MSRQVMMGGLLGFIGILVSLLNNFTLVADAAVTLSSFQARLAENTTSTRVLLTWKTASEVRTAGFNLYRSSNFGGPYMRINPQLIPASNDLLLGGVYQFVDDDVHAGQTWYYQLEDVELNGPSVRHPPISVMTKDTTSDIATWVGAGLALGIVLGGIGSGVWLWRTRVKRTRQ